MISDSKVISRLTISIVILTLLIFSFTYEDLPATIPSHFNYLGEIDAYGSKSTLYILIALQVLMFGLFWGIPKLIGSAPKLDPGKSVSNRERHVHHSTIRMITELNLGVSLMFMIVTVEIILLANGKSFGLHKAFMFLILFLCLFPIVILIKRMLSFKEN